MDSEATWEEPIPEQRPPTRNVLLDYFATALSYVAVGILTVTVIGAIRVLTIPNFDEAEAKFWAVVIIVAVGAVLAGIAVACGRVLRYVG